MKSSNVINKKWRERERERTIKERAIKGKEEQKKRCQDGVGGG